MVDNLRFFAGAARTMEGKPAGRVPRGLHVDHPPRAGRRRRPDRAVELPADDGGLEDRPRAGRPATRSSSSPRRRPRSRRCELAEIAAEFLPKGVLNVVRGGDDAGEAIVAHDGRRHGLDHRLGRGRQVRSRGPPPTRSSACTSSSAARRRSSSSTTSTWRPRWRRSPAPATTTPARTARPRRACSRAQGLRRRRRRPRRAGQGLRHGRHPLALHALPSSADALRIVRDDMASPRPRIWVPPVANPGDAWVSVAPGSKFAPGDLCVSDQTIHALIARIDELSEDFWAIWVPLHANESVPERAWRPDRNRHLLKRERGEAACAPLLVH